MNSSVSSIAAISVPTLVCCIFQYTILVIVLLACNCCYYVLTKYTAHGKFVGLMTMLWLGEPRNRDSIPCMNKRFFSSQCPGQIWGLPSTLFSEQRRGSCRLTSISYKVRNAWILLLPSYTFMAQCFISTGDAPLRMGVCDLVGIHLFQPNRAAQQLQQ